MFKKIAPLLFGAAALVLSAVLPSNAQFSSQSAKVTNVAGTNTITGNLPPQVGSYADILNVPILLTPVANNTGDATLNINSFGTSPHFRKATSSGLVALTGNELVTGVPALVMYDGTFFDILSANTATLPSLLPQGYMTPCQTSSGTPVTGCSVGTLFPTGDVTAATNLYYEPAFGNGAPIYNGTNFVNFSFTELTLAIPSSRLGNTIYDVYLFANGNVPTLAFGPAWTTSTAGSGNRGTGAGTAQISQLQGIWTNTVQISGVNGGSNFTIPANQGTLLGTCLIDASAGQVTFNINPGQSRKWACVNIYNGQDIVIQGNDPTTNWNLAAGSTTRAANGNAANNVTILSSIPLQRIAGTLDEIIEVQANGSPPFSQVNATAAVAIGFNQFTSPNSNAAVNLPSIQLTSGTVNVFAHEVTVHAKIDVPIGIGQNQLYAVESCASGTNGICTFFGGSGNMALTARWKG